MKYTVYLERQVTQVQRLVVEADRGCLFIYNDNNLRLTDEPPKETP